MVHFPEQAKPLPFEVSHDPIKGYSGRSVKLHTHIFQLPMLRISGASICVLTVPKQQVLLLPFLPEHGNTSSLRNTLRFLDRDERQATKKSGTNTTRYHRQNTLILRSPVVTVFTTRFNIHKLHVLPTQCIYVFYVDLRANSGYFPIQH